MNRRPTQRKGYAINGRDFAATLSVALRLTHGYAKHFDCDQAFFDTLKGLQLQADRLARALEKEGIDYSIPDIKAAFEHDDYDPKPEETSAYKLPLDTPSSIWDLAAKEAAKPPAKITDSTT